MTSSEGRGVDLEVLPRNDNNLLQPRFTDSFKSVSNVWHSPGGGGGRGHRKWGRSLIQEVAEVGVALLPGNATRWCGEDGRWRLDRSSSSSRPRSLCSAAVGTEEETTKVPPTSTTTDQSADSTRPFLRPPTGGRIHQRELSVSRLQEIHAAKITKYNEMNVRTCACALCRTAVPGRRRRGR